ncbi:12584_t:CDS:2, partial [Gigaspora margarita]
VNKENLYILKLTLDFKGLSINIIVVYVAPTSAEVQKSIKEYLKKHIKDIKTKKKVQRQKRGKKANCVATKEKEKQSVLVYKTKDIELRTGSDHQAVLVQLETGLNLQKRSQAENRKIRKKRLEIDIESTNKKNWEEYQAKLNKELKRKLSKNSKKGTANKLIQKKKTCVVEDISYTDAENKKLKKDIRTLGKWYRKLRKNKERGITVQEVEELKQFIEPLKNC